MALLLLAACGGGAPSSDGGGYGPITTNNAPWTNSAEFQAQYGLALIKGATLYNLGGWGNGITVAVIDTGLTASHSEFSGRVSNASYDVVNNTSDVTDTDRGHGTWVSGVIAANRDDVGMYGVAPNATLLAISANRGGVFFDDDLASAVNYAVANGARVINMSLGGAGGINAALGAALQNAANNGVAVVMAVGNSGNAAAADAPANEAGKATYDGHLVAVGSVGAGSAISTFSSMCPAGQEAFCITAPGENIVTPSHLGAGSGYVTVNGTSFSAPHVSGAIAVMLSLYPTLTVKQVINILLTTAFDPTANPTDALYGHGILDLNAAKQPGGVLTVSGAGGGALPLSGADALRMAAAFGDALQTSTVFANVAATDSYGRVYGVDLTNAIEGTTAAPATSSFHSAALTRSTPVDFGPDARHLTTHFTTVEDKSGNSASTGPVLVSFTTTTQISREARATIGWLSGTRAWAPVPSITGYTAAFGMAGTGQSGLEGLVTSPVYVEYCRDGDWRTRMGVNAGGGALAAYASADREMAPGFRVGFGGRLVAESDGVLGSRGEGVFASGYATVTAALDVGAHYRKGPHNVHALATTAASHVRDNGTGVLTDIRALRARSASIGYWRDMGDQPGDGAGVTISRPLRVSSGTGTATVSVPDGAGGAIVTSTPASLVPSGRQTNIEFSYRRTLSTGERLRLGAAYILHPGHDAGAPPVAALGLRYDHDF